VKRVTPFVETDLTDVAVDREPTSRDTIGVAAHDGSEVCIALQVIAGTGKAEHHVVDAIVAIRRANRRDDTAEVDRAETQAPAVVERVLPDKGAIVESAEFAGGEAHDADR
jgi:hypothetical protein